MTADSTTQVDPRTVRFRSTWRQWAWVVGSVALAVGLAQSFMLTAGPASTSASGEFFPVVFVGGYAAMTAAIYHWQGVTLTAEFLQVHSIRPRLIAWRDIQWITIEPLLWTQTVVVLESSGRRTRLRAPSTGPLFWDRNFEAKYRTIGEWYLARRGY